MQVPHRIIMKSSILLLLLKMFGCADDGASQESLPSWPSCPSLSLEYVQNVQRTLTDSTDLFQGAYPVPPGLTCELMEGLQVRLEDDSARYHFTHFSRRFWAEDGWNTNGFRFIHRHMDFDLAIAATAHWNADVRIVALQELFEYRRMRPMVCTTKEGSAKLEEQDRRTVRYLLHVLEHTPWFISGSENSAIHAAYIGWVLRTLDLFTGTSFFADDKDLFKRWTDRQIEGALVAWRNKASR